MEKPITRKEEKKPKIITTITELSLEHIFSGKCKTYEGISFFKIQGEDGYSKWREVSAEESVEPYGSYENFLKLHPNKVGFVGEDGFYKWDVLKDKIKEEGYDPEKYDSYIAFEDYTEEKGVIYDYILTSGGHRLTVIKELHNEGFFKKDDKIKVKLHKYVVDEG